VNRLRLIATGVVLFALTWPFLFRGGQTDGDIPVFRQYGEWIVGGQLPYRDFHPEYPPGAMGLFALPALFPEHLYLVLFQILAAAGFLLELVLLALLVDRLQLSPWLRYGTMLYAGLAPAMLGAFVLRRFDMWPAALCIGVLILLIDQRPRAAFAVLAVAIVVKTYPIVFVPIALMYIGRDRWRGAVATCCAVGLVLLAPWAAIGHVGLYLSYATQWDRHLHLDSIGAGVLLALHRPVRLSYDAGWSVFGAGAGLTAQLQTLLEVAGVVFATWFFWRSRRSPRDLVACSAAVFAAAAWLGKVLSPQFLLWVAPLVPLVADWAVLICFTGALFTTEALFPARYQGLLSKRGGEITLLDVRNAFLVLTTLALWRSLARQRTTTGGESSIMSPSFRLMRGPATKPMR
jgi:hypothetical protein